MHHHTQTFTDVEQALLESLRRYLAKEVHPRVQDLERSQTFPDAILADLKSMGLFGLIIPEAFGGLQLRLPVFAAVMETLAATWTTLAAYVNSHSTLAWTLVHAGTSAQQAHYLPLLAKGERRGALCLTEPGAGSDLQAIRTRATPNGDGYRLNGSKIFVTNGARADVYLTLARTGHDVAKDKPQLSLFLLEKTCAGVAVTSAFHKMAYGLVDTMEILLDDVQVPAAAVVGGAPGAGMRQLLEALEIGRIAIAASAVGLAANALADARRYASERKAFGVAIDQHQAVQIRLADMATKLVAARLLTLEAARYKQTLGRADMLSGMAKLFASEAAKDICEDALRIHGGYGYIQDFAVERLYREAPLYIVGEGTNDIQKMVIARRMRDEGEIGLLGLPS